jgi:hypothetical protein
MRLIFALVYISFGMWIYFQLGGEDLHPYIGIAVWFALMLSSVLVCNEGFLRKLKGQSDEEYIQDLLNRNLAVKETYQVTEAITFDDLSTSCMCHLLNISENEVLCLYGQYLYEYREIDDDPDVNQDRLFPTSEFSLIRKLKNNEVLKVEVGKKVIDESVFKDVEVERLYDLGIKLEDGEIIRGIDFSKIRDTIAS